MVEEDYILKKNNKFGDILLEKISYIYEDNKIVLRVI